MKLKLLAIAIMFTMACVAGVQADGTDTDPITFLWDQDGPLEILSHWELFGSDVSGGEYVFLARIDYLPGMAFESTQNLTAAGPDGAEIERYYVLRAVSNTGEATGFSNEVAYTFNIPGSGAPTPTKLTKPTKLRINN